MTTLSTGDQQTIQIREAEPDDAETLLVYVRQMLAEPDLDIPLTPEEFTYTVEQERDFLSATAEADNCVFLLALVNGEIVGQLGLTGGKRQATHHSAVLGLSVRRDWRRRGVGSRLMARAIQWARQGGALSRIELFVYARNHGAIHLYETYGFQVEGRRRRAVFHKGEYLDDLLMALLL